MSEAAVDAAIQARRLPRDVLILDTGCGNG
jgi:hydroxylamine reductase (hybrid-cluster protein)